MCQLLHILVNSKKVTIAGSRAITGFKVYNIYK